MQGKTYRDELCGQVYQGYDCDDAHSDVVIDGLFGQAQERITYLGSGSQAFLVEAICELQLAVSVSKYGSPKSEHVECRIFVPAESILQHGSA